jgi:hypothetical protein
MTVNLSTSKVQHLSFPNTILGNVIKYPPSPRSTCPILRWSQGDVEAIVAGG